MKTSTESMKVVYEKRNAEEGTTLVILLNQSGNRFHGQFHVVLKDTEAEQTVGSVICPTEELAMTYAAKWMK